ncbi:DUF3014 family protein [Luteibacter rhizovicinus]|uniref:DUF3014 family protein n=1 Tax=Luteibacter rhizovicinus TaxID=242606 RepID=A0A4R3YX25_9GAMM|nr:DUF3014 domain-containing protein [Luteibacter rhizovicinus]TCV97082.1 DUF3014 family protein [Luteibacter rhizovicinus]
MNKQSSGVARVLWVVVVLAAIGAGFVVWQKEKAAKPQEAAVALPSAASTSIPSSASAVQHPLGAAPAGASTAALPALGDSDSAVIQSLMALGGDGALKALLVPEHVIPRIVATIDALPKQSVGLNVLPLRTPTGSFVVGHDGNGQMVTSGKNADRYATYMYVAEKIDTGALVGWYKRYYPLFQQSYRDLGYPDGYFNDRLVAVIDHLLAAPEPKGPVVLVQPKLRYEFADPSLQALSAGQKFMLRLGPDDEARLKAKLRAIRAGVVESGK